MRHTKEQKIRRVTAARLNLVARCAPGGLSYCSPSVLCCGNDGAESLHVAAWIAPPTRCSHATRLAASTAAAQPATADARSMEAVITLQKLGVEIGVGESLIAPGSRGFFARILEHATPVTLPAFTPLVDYARGNFMHAEAGDKTVAFALDSLDAAVVYEDQVMRLSEAVAAACEEGVDASDIIAGHTLLLDEAAGALVLCAESEEPLPMYFVPHAQDEQQPCSVVLGQYANDLAYSAADSLLDAAGYAAAAAQLNSLCLVWRLEREPQRQPTRLVPTWPVSVLSRDVTFDSTDFKEPIRHIRWRSTEACIDTMRIGCTYGPQYWKAVESLKASERAACMLSCSHTTH
eukprot:17214-Heterococcus_DN1.PRE.2